MVSPFESQFIVNIIGLKPRWDAFKSELLQEISNYKYTTGPDSQKKQPSEFISYRVSRETCSEARLS